MIYPFQEFVVGSKFICVVLLESWDWDKIKYVAGNCQRISEVHCNISCTLYI